MDEQTRRQPEPEIIPPGEPLPYRRTEIWESRDPGQMHRVYIRQIGPLGATLLAAGVGVAAVIGLFFLISTAIFGLAVVGALTLAGIVMGILRGPPRSLR
ncbi:MAG TPA: hypothetical protein VGG57_08470 [Stellaceae bacterium]|jgi:hypothetical protein